MLKRLLDWLFDDNSRKQQDDLLHEYVRLEAECRSAEYDGDYERLMRRMNDVWSRMDRPTRNKFYGGV